MKKNLVLDRTVMAITHTVNRMKKLSWNPSESLEKVASTGKETACTFNC